jgi:Uma2 family endonuclease
MSTVEALRLMTAEELVAIPDDGIDRWLIRGKLRSRPWEHRSPDTSAALTNLGFLLSDWAAQARSNRGVVLVDAYHRLARDPDTVMGIDVSLITANQWSQARHRPFVECCPVLAAKVIAPHDTDADVAGITDAWLSAGIPIVWLVDPEVGVVTVYSAEDKPQVLSHGHELTAESLLPGFRVRVAELFE